MSNDITLPQSGAIVTADQITNAEAELMIRSVFPGASLPMAKFAGAYCRSLGVDVLRKPVYILKYNGIEQVAPGIGLYRIIAARSGSCGNEVVYGPEVHGLPEWIEYTALRLMPNGMVARFTAREYMRENRRKSGKWDDRPVGMLRVRAESQALRMGFPEVGAAPTYEELIDNDDEYGDNIEHSAKPAATAPRRKSKTAESLPPPEEVHAPITEIKQAITTPAEADIVDAVETRATETLARAKPAPAAGVAPGQIAYIRGKLNAAGRDVAWLSDQVGYQLADDLSNMTADAFNDAKRALL